jgi:cell division protein FtsN
MYCSECKLRVADDSVVTCPVCQGPLQSESEVREPSESVDFVDELAAVFAEEPAQDIKLDDKLDAYVRDDANLDFDPEALGLKSSEEEDPEASADDIRVLADLWEKEDIGADLDGVFADAFNLEEVAPESVPEEQVAVKPEKSVPETSEIPETSETPVMSTSVMSTPEISTPVPPENPRNLGLPLLILIVLLIAGGGGWFYMQNAGVKPENKLAREIKSPAPAPVPTKPQIKPQPEPAVVSNKPVEDKVVPVAEGNAVVTAKISPAGDETAENSAGDKPNLSTDVKVEPAVAAGSSETEAASLATTAETSTQPAAESLVAAASDSSPIVEKKTQSDAELDSEPAAENQASETQPVEKVTPEPVPVKEKAVAVPEKANPAAAPAVTVTGTRYVVHIGSFRNEAGAARQLAKLQKKGFAAYKVEVDLGEKGIWQRIFVPGGALKSDARLVQEELAKSFPQEESLVRKIKK